MLRISTNLLHIQCNNNKKNIWRKEMYVAFKYSTKFNCLLQFLTTFVYLEIK